MGAFKLVEGIINHHLLELHHVRDMPDHVPVYDWRFLRWVAWRFWRRGPSRDPDGDADIPDLSHDGVSWPEASSSRTRVALPALDA